MSIKTQELMLNDPRWCSVEDEKPKAGRQPCVIKNGSDTFIAERLVKISSGGDIILFGGVRPFASNDVMTHFLKV